MNLTLPGVSSPHSPSASTPTTAPTGDRKGHAANAQRFGDALRAAPEEEVRDDAVAGAQGRVDDSAAPSQDETFPATTPPQDAAPQAAGSAATDWLQALPAQSAPIGLGLAWSGLAAASTTGTAPSDALVPADDALSNPASGVTATTLAPTPTTPATAAALPGAAQALRAGSAAGAAVGSTAGDTTGRAPSPSDAQPDALPDTGHDALPDATLAAPDAGKPSTGASASASAWASSTRNGGPSATDPGLSDAATPPTPAPTVPPGDWQLSLGRLPAAPGGTVALAPQQPAQWREPMLNALGEHVQWQLQRGVDQAVIRLEPPQMGRVDILIRQDANGLQVQLSATHREVVQQLHAVSDTLRQDLGQRQTLSVSVQVSDGSPRQPGQPGQGSTDGQRHRPSPDQDSASPTRALRDSEDSASPASFAMHAAQQAAPHPELG